MLKYKRINGWSNTWLSNGTKRNSTLNNCLLSTITLALLDDFIIKEKTIILG